MKLFCQPWRCCEPSCQGTIGSWSVRHGKLAEIQRWVQLGRDERRSGIRFPASTPTTVLQLDTNGLLRPESPLIVGAVRHSSPNIYYAHHKLFQKKFIHARVSTRKCDVNATIIQKNTKIAIYVMRPTMTGTLTPRFRGSRSQISNGLRDRKWNSGVIFSSLVNLIEISWTIIEKSRPEHDQNWKCSCELLPTSSIFCRNVKTIGG